MGSVSFYLYFILFNPCTHSFIYSVLSLIWMVQNKFINQDKNIHDRPIWWLTDVVPVLLSRGVSIDNNFRVIGVPIVRIFDDDVADVFGVYFVIWVTLDMIESEYQVSTEKCWLYIFIYCIFSRYYFAFI